MGQYCQTRCDSDGMHSQPNLSSHLLEVVNPQAYPGIAGENSSSPISGIARILFREGSDRSSEGGEGGGRWYDNILAL